MTPAKTSGKAPPGFLRGFKRVSRRTDFHEKIAACKLLVERRGTQIDVSHHAGIFRVRGALKSKCEREIFLPIGEIRAHLVRAADQHYLSDTVRAYRGDKRHIG